MRFRDHDNLLRHSALLMAATMSVNAANVLFQMIMMRRLPVVEYGSMAAMLGLVAMVSTPLEAVRTAAAHFSARLVKSGERNRIGGFVRKWSWAAAVAAAILLMLAAVAGRPIAVFFQIESSSVIAVSFAGMAILLFIPLFSGALQGIQAFVAFSLMSLCWAVARLAAGALLVYCVSATALAALVAQGLGVAVGVAVGCVGLALVLRRGWAAPDPARIAVIGGDGALTGGIGYLVNSLVVLSAYSVLMVADVSMVKHFFAPADAGLFARAATIGRAIIFLPMPIAMAMFPKVVSDGATSDDDLRNLRRAVLYAALLIFAAAAAACILARFGWRLFAGQWPDEYSLRLVRQVILAMSPLGLAFVMMNFDLAQRRFRAAYMLLPVAAAYVGAVCEWHGALWHVIAAMGAANLVSVLLLAVPSIAHKSSPVDAALSSRERETRSENRQV